MKPEKHSRHWEVAITMEPSVPISSVDFFAYPRPTLKSVRLGMRWRRHSLCQSAPVANRGTLCHCCRLAQSLVVDQGTICRVRVCLRYSSSCSQLLIVV